jgi:ADP-heptose:LPS heptosyltransferase
MALIEKSSHSRSTHNSGWRIVTFHKPCLWNRTNLETWYFVPKRRYILNANQLDHVATHVDKVSDLTGSSHYNPLRAGANIMNAEILVERYRDRGFGDMLFLTGVFDYLRHISGNTCKIYFYSLFDRGQLMDNHLSLATESPLLGPVNYDDLPHYHYHWFIDSVTEYDEEKDQLNVYDALYKQIGIDPASVPHQYKRPSMNLVEQDWKDLDQLYYFIFKNRQIDLRTTPYYVVSPLANSNIRMPEYTLWLRTIREMAKARPVVVIGQVQPERLPSTDMPYGSFIQRLEQMAQQVPVINLISAMPVRVVSAIIAKSVCLITPDTGTLFMGQANRVPCVSLWGTHSPHVRIGHDRELMELAVWKKDACVHAPCCYLSRFPYEKCPSGENQVVCECYKQLSPIDIIEKITQIENAYKAANAITIPPKGS